MKITFSCLLLQSFVAVGNSFAVFRDQPACWRSPLLLSTSATSIQLQQDDTKERSVKKDENDAMKFLRKIGKVGGAANRDFTNVIGIDEGPAGKSSGKSHQSIRKAKAHYKPCTVEGIIDDMSESFPVTACGTQWQGITDRIMGGVSSGSITRERVEGKNANVLRGDVRVDGLNQGFVQMATDLATDPSISQTVDACEYDGVELDIQCHSDQAVESFNVHLKNKDCTRQFSSYRATFTVDSGSVWETIRLPWSDFVGYGPGAKDLALDLTTLRRIGIVAIGREMAVDLAVAGVRFYSTI